MIPSQLKSMTTFTNEGRVKPPMSYRANIDVLPQHIVTKYFILEKDKETTDWLKEAANVSALRILIANLLRHFVSLTTANGIVGRGGMFVVSTEQAANLLLGRTIAQQWTRYRDTMEPPFETLLDVGAGDGGVTSRLQPLFKRVTATEFSIPMRWRLWRRGYEVLPYQDPFTNKDGSRRYYDVISCLNVLDRADRPLDLLASMRDSLGPEGILLLAVVLPWCPFVEDGSIKRRPSQMMPMDGGECCKGATFEQSLQCLMDNVLVPFGFQLERWCKLPYLCEGNMIAEYAVLHDAVMVLTRKGDNGTATAEKDTDGSTIHT
ncbi:DREV methyltransferase, putative [Trypanosoma equiperdum]|uniref:DREV methyltransferase, putative n=1 Tax=Trypanosoma equiperdum TaxID=5694 RepID=A0A1G4IHX5_TRYEQ|nr:DREV methyltransferase, putative [Trypanosoma equiperdum]